MQLVDYIDSIGLYQVFQSAYRANHDIALPIDNRKSVVLVLLDRSAAFATVDHFFLLSRLSARFGICDHLQASRFPLFTSEMFQVGTVTLLPGTKLRLVSFNKCQQNEETWRAHVSPTFPRFSYGKDCFQCHGQFLFPRCKLCLRYATRQGSLTKIQVGEHFQKFCEHEQASDSSKGQILRAIRAKAKFCEHFQIGWDHSIPLKNKLLFFTWRGLTNPCLFSLSLTPLGIMGDFPSFRLLGFRGIFRRSAVPRLHLLGFRGIFCHSIF